MSIKVSEVDELLTVKQEMWISSRGYNMDRGCQRSDKYGGSI